MKKFKPLLAAPLDGVDLKTIHYPLLASPKLDGVRIIINDGADDRKGVRQPGWQPATRKIVQLPNVKIRAFLSRPELAGLDGELASGDITHPDVFNSTTRIVMKREGPGMSEPVWLYTDAKKKPQMSFVPVEGALRIDETNFYIFDDCTHPDMPFVARFERARARIEALPEDLKRHIKLVPHRVVRDDIQLGSYEEIMVREGYEGVMVRRAEGPYKYGRSTVNEMILAKVKRFADTEGVRIGYEELMINENEKLRDALGNAKRSSHAENLVPGGTLGAIVYRLPEFDNATVKCGTGFTDEQRQHIWDNREAQLGTVDVLRYQPSGMKDLPRFPSWKGPRKD